MRKKIAGHLGTLVALIFLASGVHAEDRALVIGINTYPYLKGRNLRVSSQDALRFAEFLQDTMGFKQGQIKILRDWEAKRDDIVDGFRDWLVNGTQPGDRVVFYFSGHGLRFHIGNDIETRHQALAPSDVMEAKIGRQSEFENAIPDEELTALRQELRGRRVLFVIDSCHSGKIARGKEEADADITTIRAKTATPGELATLRGADQNRFLRRPTPAEDPSTQYALWAAAAPNQIAFEDSEQGGSVFTLALIRGVRGRAADRNGDGLIQVPELLNFVSDVSKAFCASRKMECLDGLTPNLYAVPEDSYRTAVFWPPTAPVAQSQPAGDLAQAVFRHSNDFDLKLKMTPDPRVEQGQLISFTVTSAMAGRLMLFDQESDGKLRLIFPNLFAVKSGASLVIAANLPLKIPQTGKGYYASPRGKGRLLALVAADDVGLDQLVSEFDEKGLVKNPAKIIGAIAARLQKPIVSAQPDVPDRRPSWAFVWQDYEVW